MGGGGFFYKCSYSSKSSHHVHWSFKISWGLLPLVHSSLAFVVQVHCVLSQFTVYLRSNYFWLYICLCVHCLANLHLGSFHWECSVWTRASAPPGMCWGMQAPPHTYCISEHFSTSPEDALAHWNLKGTDLGQGPALVIILLGSCVILRNSPLVNSPDGHEWEWVHATLLQVNLIYLMKYFIYFYMY